MGNPRVLDKLRRDRNPEKPGRGSILVKFAPNGEIMTNEKGRKLAGRVAKGMTKGCIACHSNAGGERFWGPVVAAARQAE